MKVEKLYPELKKELFNNTSITTFSRHKEKLGMWE